MRPELKTIECDVCGGTGILPPEHNKDSESSES